MTRKKSVTENSSSQHQRFGRHDAAQCPSVSYETRSTIQDVIHRSNHITQHGAPHNARHGSRRSIDTGVYAQSTSTFPKA
jgi:hypothetical protein